MSNEEPQRELIAREYERDSSNGISIIRHIKIGYINSTKICIANMRNYKNLTNTEHWKSIIAIYDEDILSGDKRVDVKL
ncbi:MAG: hypothetical protein Ta2E_00920 [Mycoplasmoidaceae bacterium]|nr:MAG: hypothetical protein Ta2E_00920 [Mycoplasmoidaceae bacterium]